MLKGKSPNIDPRWCGGNLETDVFIPKFPTCCPYTQSVSESLFGFTTVKQLQRFDCLLSTVSPSTGRHLVFTAATAFAMGKFGSLIHVYYSTAALRVDGEWRLSVNVSIVRFCCALFLIIKCIASMAMAIACAAV